MLYKEIPPPAYLSKHIESYWEIDLLPNESSNIIELFLPNCTFNIIFTNQVLHIGNISKKRSKASHSKAIFIGQISSSIQLHTTEPIHIYGIRFKPFAFANIIKQPIYLLNDQFFPLQQLFDLGIEEKRIIEDIVLEQSIEEKAIHTNNLMSLLFKESFTVDEVIRAQTNYILEQKGLVKISNLFSDFGISKVTLRKHFLNKVGLPPKKVARIWRMNYFLYLKEQFSNENLTSLCLSAGFYDQAHFNKEFRLLLGNTPRHFFQNNDFSVKIFQQEIERRFTNQYDPR